jgi:hypothetical protein
MAKSKKIKQVYFNTETEQDLLLFADGLPNFSDWVKKQITRGVNSTGVDIAQVEQIVLRILAERGTVRDESLARTAAVEITKMNQFL